MKRKVIKVQDAPNVMPRFYCPCTMVPVKNHAIADIMKYPDGFKFCPICGAELDYPEGLEDCNENKRLWSRMTKQQVFTLEKVAEILCEVFGDPCACNFNGNDEWLPQKCKYGLTDCPDPPDELSCWKEYLLHRKEAN